MTQNGETEPRGPDIVTAYVGFLVMFLYMVYILSEILYIYIYIYTFIYLFVFLSIFIFVFICLFICLHVCMHSGSWHPHPSALNAWWQVDIVLMLGFHVPPRCQSMRSPRGVDNNEFKSLADWAPVRQIYCGATHVRNRCMLQMRCRSWPPSHSLVIQAKRGECRLNSEDVLCLMSAAVCIKPVQHAKTN